MFTKLKQTLSHLPVNQIMDEVALAFAADMVPVVTSEVASGKTLLLPVAIAEQVEGMVYVLEPTRFLANNAAEAMREILGKDHQNLVGCLNSNRSDDKSIVHPDNKVIFVTVGFALSAGIVTTATNILFDEAHETSIDLSLAKAIVHKRRERGETVHTAVLSATIDEANEIAFWGEDHTVHFTTKGSAFPTESFHRPAWSLGEGALNLIEEHDRKGILVFVEGKEEIKDAAENIRNALAKQGFVEDTAYELHAVHGNSTGEERRIASRQPATPIKILIGTNVIEQGISLSWVDGGISNGKTKVMHVTGNNHRLVREDLPAWRIIQQMGRVCRFKPGVFILADTSPISLRPNLASPDISRLPLTELVMHCAKLPDINLRELTFSPAEQPSLEAIRDAIDTLVDFGLVSESSDGHLSLTDDGILVENLPISYQAAAALCEAHKCNALATMLPLIATIDVGDIRQDTRIKLYGANRTNSDVIYQVASIASMLQRKHNGEGSLRDLAVDNNISLRKYRDYDQLLVTLEDKTGLRANYAPYLDRSIAKDLDMIAKQVIFRGMMRNRYPIGGWRGDVSTSRIGAATLSYGEAKLSNSTQVSTFDNFGTRFVTGNLRTITPRSGFPFTVIENITLFGDDDFQTLAIRFGAWVVDPKGELFREKVAERSYPSAATRFGGFPSSTNRQDEPVEEKPKEIGTLGDILQGLLNAR